MKWHRLFTKCAMTGTLSQQHGKIALDFSRESDSLIFAIVSAIRDVESVGINGLQVSEVRPPSMSAY